MKKKSDIILIIVDKLTKYFHIILFKKNYIVEYLRAIILNKLIRYNEILKKITSNRNILFTSNH